MHKANDTLESEFLESKESYKYNIPYINLKSYNQEINKKKAINNRYKQKKKS